MKSINLFGQEEHVFTNRRKSQKSIFDDYEGFVEKFNPKKTTDDCYTPPAVYDYVLQYVADHCDIDGMTVVRPFYPGGDYESLVYPDNCVVIDNPPFSIVSQIVRFYLKRGIKFFLFAPHLTLFSADLDCTRIVCGAAIVYENGAKVNTSFLSNMFGEAGVIGDPVLYEGIDAICSAPKAELPKYKYPDCVLTVSDVAYIVKNKGEIKIDKREMVHHSALDIQKKHGKSIYGSRDTAPRPRGTTHPPGYKQDARRRSGHTRRTYAENAVFPIPHRFSCRIGGNGRVEVDRDRSNYKRYLRAGY